MNSGMEFKKLFGRKQAGSNHEETKGRKRSENRGPKIEDRVIGRKPIIDLRTSIINPRSLSLRGFVFIARREAG
jgi:hypothetical protein